MNTFNVKLMEIVSEPLKLVCDWAREPMKDLEVIRQIRLKKADVNLAIKQAETNLKLKEQDEVLGVKVRKWNTEIDQFINEQEDARRIRIVESLKRYQLEMGNAYKDIIVEIGIMTVELREKANKMTQERITEFQRTLDEEKTRSMKRIADIHTEFKDQPDVIQQFQEIEFLGLHYFVDETFKFIADLREDIKKMNANIDGLTRIAMENIKNQLLPISQRYISNNDTLRLPPSTD